MYVIDDGYAPTTGRILEAFKAISPAPVRFVVDTHWHFDRTGGNENRVTFRRNGDEVPGTCGRRCATASSG